MRVVRATLRRPQIVLAALLFLASTWYFRSAVVPEPRYVVRTRVNEEPSRIPRLSGPHLWSSVRAVSDDGERVVIGVHESERMWTSTRLELWEPGTRTIRTPTHWRDEEWSGRLSGGPYEDNGLLQLLSDPAGQAVLEDEAAWAALRERMKGYRAKAIEDLGRTIRPDLLNPPPPPPDEKEPDPFPKIINFSPDGRLISYVSRNGYPVHMVSELLGDGTVIEEFRTGKRVAFLPRVEYLADISPHGRTAVTRHFPVQREGEEPRLFLWDLETSTVRAKLLLGDNHLRTTYSPDGRYLFAQYWIWGNSSEIYLRWWDTTTGQQVGHIVNAVDHAVVDGGRVLVTHPRINSKKGGSRESYRLDLWDVATGDSLGEWNLDARSNHSGMIDDLVAPASGPYLAGEYDPDYGVGRSPAGRVSDRLGRALGQGDRPAREQIILWDVSERREVGRLPGKSAAFSRNGHWLASIDADGVLRVWDLPLRRPWERILGFAAVATLVGMIVGWTIARIVQRSMRQGLGAAILRAVAWIRVSSWRRRWAIATFTAMAVCFGGLVWHSFAVSRARVEMEAAYEEIGKDVTESDMIALVGRPPDEGPLPPLRTPFKGGGEIQNPVTVHRWTRHGIELEVHFGADGTAKASYITTRRGLDEQLVDWLGW